METHIPKTRPVVDCLIVAITLLGPALGGATQLWAQAIVFAAGGLLMLCCPPRALPPRALTIVLSTLVVLAASTLLPAHWFPPLIWRGELQNELGLTLASTYSLQPWLTLEKTLLMGCTLLWGLFLLSHSWHLGRLELLQLFAGGLVLMTLAALFFFFWEAQPALWKVEAGRFGFFPHRNQTANLLGLGGVILMALALESYRKRKQRTLFWALAFLLIGFGLVVNYSRAGILIYFFGALSCLVWTSRFARNHSGVGMGIAGLLMFLAFFATFGGETWERFRPYKPDDASPVLDFRILLQKDALQLAGPASWHGLGLGNFEPLFAQVRNLSLNESRALHPDSDWLWLWIEMGWPAVGLIVAAAVLLLRDCWPFAPKSSRRIRVAAALCVILFLIHGLVDVSGHRLGTVLPLLFLAVMARNRSPDQLPQPAWAPHVFRLAAVGMIAISTIWMLSSGPLPFPTTARLAMLKEQVAQAAENKNYAAVIASATAALEIAPLDWQLYFNRAGAWAHELPDTQAAVADFQRARYLEPNSSKLPMQEGLIWLGRNNSLTLQSWDEALHRAPWQAESLFYLMILATDKHPETRQSLWRLTADDPRLKLIYLQHDAPGDFQVHLQEWLAMDPNLRALAQPQLKLLLGFWAEKGDRQLLELHLQQKPEWMEVGGVWLAEMEAERKNFMKAYEVARSFEQRPKLPPLGAPRGISKLQQEFRSRPHDFSVGFALYSAHINQEEYAEALEVLKRLTGNPKCPNYFRYLEAELLARNESWEEAWLAWKRYLSQKNEPLPRSPAPAAQRSVK